MMGEGKEDSIDYTEYFIAKIWSENNNFLFMMIITV